jgi:hypothetical protein
MASMKELQQQLEAKAARLAAIQKGERALGCLFFLLSSSHASSFRGENNPKKNLDRCSLPRRLCGGFCFSMHGSFILKVLRFWMGVEERWAFVVYSVCDIPEGWLNRRMMTALELFS